MTWATPDHKRSQVNKAGKILVSNNATDEENAWATGVLVNWRSSHGYPINTFQSTLRTKLKEIDTNAIVAQRLKRTPSIVLKLIRYDTMKLSTMQDIAGLRAVVENMDCVRHLVYSYQRSIKSKSRFNHISKGLDDYISTPKSSGYRSIHMIYRYQNDREKAQPYNGLRIELQIRTRIQHAWATAVETIGMFLKESLKASEGSSDWLDFFSLTGSAFAHLERTAPVNEYAHLSAYETYQLVRQRAEVLDVEKKLSGYTVAANIIVTKRQAWRHHLVILDTTKRIARVQSFARDRLEAANEAYAKVEEDISNGKPFQAVLVSTASIDQLKNAYPSYFLDTKAFVEQLNRINSITHNQ